MKIFDRLDQIHDLPHQEREALRDTIRIEYYDANEIIQNIHNTCRTLYFIEEGLARIFYYKDGEDITEHFSFEGDVIVRAESLFTGQPTPKGIQALVQSRMASISATRLFQLYDTYPKIERLFRLLFEEEYVASIRRVESLQLKSATERYKELLQGPREVALIPQKHIATYLGITPVSLSRIRSSLTP